MKIKVHDKAKVIMENPLSIHNYFGWPTAVTLKNGKIAVAASGFRLGHICPFGKTVISYSEDDGKTYTLPTPVIDTYLDDRDGGLCTFGESGLIITSFNNRVDWQKQITDDPYKLSYLNKITPEQEDKYLGATFRVSYDNGITFGPLYKSPITSPHGPCELSDGTILWVGCIFDGSYMRCEGKNDIQVYSLNPENGEMKFVGEIENIEIDAKKYNSYEPHAIVLDSGTLLTHIRVEDGNGKIFTIYQSKSTDGGKTWSKPVQILEDKGGAPAHIFKHSSGTLICTYGDREKPYGIKAMFSKDGGETWDTNYTLYINNEISSDLGYPSTVELPDRSLLTIFYAHNTKWDDPAIIMQTHWSFEK